MFDKKFWKNKRVLVTGHYGFKGSWLCSFLSLLNADTYGLSINDNKLKKNFHQINQASKITTILEDVRNYDKLNKVISDIKPEIIIHLAAQSLVIEGYSSPHNTFTTNLLGTLNLLEIFRETKSKVLLNITSDKVYKPSNQLLSEGDELFGIDPYSNSKSCSELISYSYQKSFFEKSKYKGFATVRAGNVIGGGDWSKNRIVPDIMNSIFNKKKLILRNPNSIRPWQHVLEPISGYLKLIELIYKKPNIYSSSYNFGPNKSCHKTVNYMVKYFEKLANTKTRKEIHKIALKETKFLALNSSYAQKKIKWSPKLDIEKSLDFTFKWYQSYFNKNNMTDFTRYQIAQYMDL
jgi:CDP-glucose 4,6-dehydratase